MKDCFIERRKQTTIKDLVAMMTACFCPGQKAVLQKKKLRVKAKLRLLLLLCGKNNSSCHKIAVICV